MKITYYNCTDGQLVAALLKWAATDCPRTFDSDFLGSVADKYYEFEKLTERQRAALENIAEKFRVDVADYF